MSKKDICWLLIIVVCVSLSVWFYFLNKETLKERAEMDAFAERIEAANNKMKLIIEKQKDSSDTQIQK